MKIKRNYTKKKYLKDVESIIRFIENFETQKFRVIYAVPRGGVHLGKLLSNRLKIELKTSLNDVLCHIIKHKIQKDNVLIVDDIVDTGKTLLKIRQDFPDSLFISLWRNNTCNFPPNMSLNLSNDNDWIVFPWEDKKEETKVNGTKI